VPPDYFSRTGQLWGNPIYKWHLMAERGYAWWVERVRATLALVDIVRLDHFRGFEAYWEVPADHKTAEHGRWADGPGAGFFETLRDRLGGELPLIAENLGVITDEVEALREQFALPGMAVFQFSFGPDATTSAFPPHKHTDDLVVYTGTHDNDTTRGWWEGMPGDDPVRQYVTQYLAADRSDEPFHEQAIRAWMASPGATFIVPVQDLLGLGSESRMNTPGQPAGNWQWRLPPGALAAEHAARLAALTRIYDRLAPR
jgi:4-alpha-glucanotransferase